MNMVEQDITEKTGGNGEAEVNTQGNASASPASVNRNYLDLFSKFFIVEFSMKGVSDGVSSREERLYNKFFRIDRNQKSSLDKLSVYFYREVKRNAAFKLDKKYVVSERKLSRIEKKFGELEDEFKPLREEIFKDVTANWDAIIKDLGTAHPDLKFDPDKLDELKPGSIDFLKINYSLIPLKNKLKELDGLKDLFLSKEYKNPEIARRMENLKGEMETQIRKQYEEKFEDLTAKEEKLKKALKSKKKAEYKEKLWEKANALTEDIQDMAELIGEEDSIRFRLDSMKELLANTIQFKPRDDESQVEFVTPEVENTRQNGENDGLGGDAQ